MATKTKTKANLSQLRRDLLKGRGLEKRKYKKPAQPSADVKFINYTKNMIEAEFALGIDLRTFLFSKSVSELAYIFNVDRRTISRWKKRLNSLHSEM